MGSQGRRPGGDVKVLPIISAALDLSYFYLSNRQTVPLTGRKSRKRRSGCRAIGR